MLLVVDKPEYQFNNRYGNPSVCKLRIFNSTNGGSVAVFTHIENMSLAGPSVTIMMEHFIQQICQEFNLNFNSLIVIDHSPGYEDIYGLVSGRMLARVFFHFDRNGEVYNLSWKDISPAELENFTDVPVSEWEQTYMNP